MKSVMAEPYTFRLSAEYLKMDQSTDSKQSRKMYCVKYQVGINEGMLLEDDVWKESYIP